MKNSNKNMDRSNFHSWINFPNKRNRKCTVCGCIQYATYSNATGKITTIYIKNNITYNEFIPCIKPNYNI